MPAVLIAVCLALAQAPRVADDAASYQARKQLFDVLDLYAGNPTAEQVVACGVLIDQIIAAMPRPTLNYYIDAAKAAELVGLPDKAMTILQTAATNLGTEKWPGVNQTVGVGANMWLGRIARDSGHPQEAADAFSRAAEAASGEYGPLVRSMCLSYAGEVYASQLNQPDRAAALFEQAKDMTGFQKGSGESQFYADWAQRNLQYLRNNASDTVAPASEMLDPQIFLFPILNGVSLANSQAMGVYGNARYKLTAPYLDKQGKESKSSLDQEISQILLAGEYFADKKWDAGETLLKKVFSSSGFLAPVAGLKLALAYQDQQKLDQAIAVLDDLGKRWPNSNWPQYANRLKGHLTGQSGASQPPGAQSTAPVNPQATSLSEKTAAGTQAVPAEISSPPVPSDEPVRHAGNSVRLSRLFVLAAGSAVVFGALTFAAGWLLSRKKPA